MDILIRTIDFDSLMPGYKAVWKLLMRKHIFYRIIIILLGAMLILFDYIFPSNKESSLNFNNTMGIAIIAIGVFMLFQTLRQRAKYFLHVKKYIDDAKKANVETETRLTDNNISIKNFESYHELTWSVFTSYIVYNDYLLLFHEATVAYATIVKSKDLSEEQFIELMDFVKVRLPEKKYSVF